MCGICGYMSSEKLQDKTLSAMALTIKHRGPDAEGSAQFIYNETYIGFAHRRLAIIDLDSRANQPYFSNDQSSCLIYNGEIYNFNELKNEIGYRYEFKTTSDTEVVLAAYEIYGIKFVEKLIGIFSIAIFDNKTGELHLVRDRHGVKPLYYYFTEDEIVFGSELRPIMSYPKFKKNLDLEAVQVMLAMKYIPAPKSIFKNVYKVKPGSILTFKENKLIDEWNYWDPINVYLNTIKTNPNLDDYKNELEEAIKRNLISDVGVATFLSGGIDSSLVSAFAKKNYDKITSYSIGFSSKDFDESVYAQSIANSLNLKNKIFNLDDSNMLDAIKKIPEIFDEPFADSSQIPTYIISERVSKDGVKVVLSGDGGDEFFFGYNMYDLSEQRYHKFKFFRNFARIYNLSFLKNKLGLIGYVSYLLDSIESYYYGLYSGFSGYYAYRIMKDKKLPNFFKENFSFLNKIKNENPRVVNAIFDQKIYMPDDILVKVDRASMAVSLESRVPLLDHTISEFSYKSDIESHNKKNQKKYILKSILELFVSKSLIYRKKQGFAVPLDDILNNKNIKSSLLNFTNKEFIEKQSLFDHSVINKQINSYYSKREKKYRKFLWSFFVFQMWYEKYMIEGKIWMDFEIYTVTYNRPKLLYKLYDSIISTNKLESLNLGWLVIYNSFDYEYEKLHKLLLNQKNLKYSFKILDKNYGLSFALNIAHEMLEGEFCMRVDDDLFLKDSILMISENLNQLRNDKQLAGGLYDMSDKKGDVIGKSLKGLPSKLSNFDVHHKYKIIGDKARIYKKEIISTYEYPIYDGELYAPDLIVYYKIDYKFKLLIVGKSILEREYLDDGITKNLPTRMPKIINGLIYSYKDLLRHPDSNLFYYSINSLKFSAHAARGGYSVSKVFTEFNEYRLFKFIFLFSLPIFRIFYRSKKWWT